MKGTSWNTGGASGDTDGVHNILFLKRQEAKTPHHAQPPKAFNQFFFRSSLLLSSEASILRYNCMVPFNILVQLGCRCLIFQSSSIWNVGLLYGSSIWVLVVLWRRGTTGTEKSKNMPIFSITDALLAATIKAVNTNISFYKYFHPLPSSFFNSWTPPWKNMFLKQIYTFLFHPYSTFQTHWTLNRSSWSQGLW